MNSGTDGLRAEIPRIKRARDFHLYDFRGRRYLDLCLDDGRAFLGHKAGRIVGEMKNSLEKGLSAGYPSVYIDRLGKQVKRIFSDITSVSAVFSGQGCSWPVFRPLGGGALPDEVFELILPMAGSGMLKILCAVSGEEEKLPSPDAVPPFILSGLCRAAAELASFDAQSAEGSWKGFDSGLWRREGPWLYPEVSEEVYPEVFIRLLEKGILISPDYNIPSCAPYIFTEGEIAPIREVEGEYIR